MKLGNIEGSDHDIKANDAFSPNMRKKVKTAKGLSTQSEKKNASSRILLMNSAVINSFYSSKRGLGTALFLMTIHHWDNGIAPLQKHAI
jgi:hypothetical protein